MTVRGGFSGFAFSGPPHRAHLSAIAVPLSGRRGGEGEDGAKEGDRAFLHRGIAARSFLRSFVLAYGMEVTGAVLEHGLLHIDVVRTPPANLAKAIPITTAG